MFLTDVNGDRKGQSLIQTKMALINNDLDMHIQAKTNDRKVRRFGDILAPLSRETKLKMRLRE